MKLAFALLTLLMVVMPSFVLSQDRAATERQYALWLEQTIWPRAQAEGVARRTFDQAFAGVSLNWDLPGLIIPGQARPQRQTQAEFRPPARYFASGIVGHSTTIGRRMLNRHATTLAQIEQRTGVPGHIILSIWGRESSFGQAAIPHDVFEILGTRGFLSARAAYFTEELIAALKILQSGYVSRNQMKSSWAGALGQPQFMPTSYLAHAVDGDGDGEADIWRSEADTLASIGAYLANHGWNRDTDWGFEVTVPATVSCALEGIDNGRPVQQWRDMGITRVSGRPFPSPELTQDGYLLMPAGRYGPALIVTSNFYTLKDYNESDAYALFVGHVGDRIKYGVGDFTGPWQPVDDFLRTDIVDLQIMLEAQGFDVGGADGLIGHKTRRSIGQWQAQTGTTETCYPDLQLLSAVQR